MGTRVLLPPFERLGEVAWRSRPLAALVTNARAVERRFGEPGGRDEDSNGCGLFDWWTIRFPCALEVGLELMQIRPDGSWQAATDPDEDRSLNLYANQRADRDHLRFHLALKERAPSRWSPTETFDGPRLHVVMRQDDNGNVVEIARCTSACEAVGMRDALEATGHRQLYWVEVKEGA